MPELVDWNAWGGTWVWLKTRYGKLLCYDGKDHNEQYENLAYQPNIIDWLETNKYDVFIDLGAHIGMFSMVAAKHCKKVIAYEASPILFGVLLYNVRFFNNVVCKYNFVSDKSDIAKMKDQIDMVGVETEGNGAISYNVPIVELDEELCELIQNEKTFIKMDIEGSESKALSKASKLIQMLNIDWIIDSHPWKGVSQQQVADFFPHRNVNIGENVIVVR